MDKGQTVSCPYCGEPTCVAVDPDGGSSQRFVSDCEVCCRPMELRVTIGSDGAAAIQASTEDA
jgi:hypothetical protein